MNFSLMTALVILSGATAPEPSPCDMLQMLSDEWLLDISKFSNNVANDRDPQRNIGPFAARAYNLFAYANKHLADLNKALQIPETPTVPVTPETKLEDSASMVPTSTAEEPKPPSNALSNDEIQSAIKVLDPMMESLIELDTELAAKRNRQALNRMMEIYGYQLALHKLCVEQAKSRLPVAPTQDLAWLRRAAGRLIEEPSAPLVKEVVTSPAADPDCPDAPREHNFYGRRLLHGKQNCWSYTVGVRDELWKIAAAFHLNTRYLCSINHIPDCDRIEIGQTIMLRGSKKQNLLLVP